MKNGLYQGSDNLGSADGNKANFLNSVDKEVYTSDNEHAVYAKEPVTYGFEFLVKCLSVTCNDKQKSLEFFVCFTVVVQSLCRRAILHACRLHQLERHTNITNVYHSVAINFFQNTNNHA